MSRLLAIIPLGFAGFCIAAAIDCWQDFLNPQLPGMRVESFGVAWLESCGAIIFLAVAVAILVESGRERGEKGT